MTNSNWLTEWENKNVNAYESNAFLMKAYEEGIHCAKSCFNSKAFAIWDFD